MQPQVYKQEGAEGHGRPLEKSGSHVIMSLHTWPLLWILTVAPFIYEKKNKKPEVRSRQGLAKSPSYLDHPQHLQLALLAFWFRTWGALP